MGAPLSKEFDWDKYEVTDEKPKVNAFDWDKYEVKEPSKRVGAGAVASDIYSQVKKVPGALWGAATQIPGQLDDLMNGDDPYSFERAGRVAAAGLAKGGRGLLNIPGNAVDYLKERELIPDWIQAARPTELNKRNYLEDAGVRGHRAGDDLIEGTAAFAPNLAFGGPVRAGFMYGVGQNEDPITMALLAPTAKGIAKGIGGVGNIATPIVKKGTGAVGNTAVKGASGVKNIVSRVPAEQLAKEIAVTNLENAERIGGQKYTSVFDDAKKAGITKADIKQTYAKNFFENATPDQRAVVSKAFKTKNLTDIHDAYKEVSGFVEDLKGKGKQMAPSEKIILAKAQHVQANLKNGILDGLKKAGGTDLSTRFLDANKYWQKNVIPNKYNAKLKAFRAGELTAEDLMKDLKNNRKFKAQMGDEYAQVEKYNQREGAIKFLKELGLNYIGAKGAGRILGAIF